MDRMTTLKFATLVCYSRDSNLERKDGKAFYYHRQMCG